MKVLIATEIYWPWLDGGSIFERALAHGLAARGHDVRVVTVSLEGRPHVVADGKTQIHRLRGYRVPGKFGKGGARTSWRPGGAIAKLLDEWRPDVIHSHNPFGIGRASLLCAQKRQIPFVATNHNMPENTLDNLGLLGRLIPGGVNRIWQWQMKYLNQANFVTSPTQTAVDLLLAHGLSVPHRPISNGVDTKRYRPQNPVGKLREKYHLPSKPTVSYVGRLDGEKRMDVWMKAVPLIRQQIDAHFLVTGKGTELMKLKRQAIDLGVAEHVTFTGPVDHDELPGIYRLGNVFAIASPAELQSIVMLEAMASGLPVVAADAVALPELCKSGRNGYLFLPGDPRGLANGVTRILQNPKMAQKMGDESRKIIEQFHDVREMPKNYEAVYKEVTGLKK